MEYLIYSLVVVVSIYIIWKGSDMLDRYAEQISTYHKLPPIIHGSIIVAVGSSFPELSSTIISTLVHGEFNLGLSAVVGSAVFNILAIPALSRLFSKHPLKADKELVFKDAQFYLIAVVVTLITFSFAIIYFPLDLTQHTGYYTRGLVLIPFGTYLIYLFLQFLEVQETITDKSKSRGNPYKMWVMLILSLLFITGGVEGLIQVCLFLGDEFNTPTFIWGLTIMAVVTSLPDALVSIRLARANKGVVSLSNVLGSNIFDLLIALPAGILIAGNTIIDFSLAVPLMAGLTAATLLLFVFMRYKLDVNKTEAWILLLAYISFIAWAITL